jgi:hypothetical protein
MIWVMASELQNIVDELASRLDAPTVLEDHEERMVAYSSHSQPIDEVRRESILRRATRREVMSWFRDQGIVAATEPLRIPGQPDQGILGRLCVPVRYQGRLMGWLFLIDDRARLSAADIAAARRAAEHAALLLYEEELGTRLTSGALAHLLSPDASLREAAAGQIVDQGLLPARAPVVAAVIQPLGVGDQLPREAVSEALQDAARASREDGALRAGYADHGVVLARVASVADDSAGLGEARLVADALRHRLRKVPGARVVAAAGDPQPRLRDAHLSYRHARLAAKVAAVVPPVGDLVRWQGLGVFRALAQLPADAAESSLDPRLTVLFADGDEELVRTLETYLDLGCDVKAASARLHLHRATLYYRLDKAEKLCGFRLRDGHDRLAIHLGFKLARLADLHPYPEAPPEAEGAGS